LERRILAMMSPFRPRYPRLTFAAIGAGVTLSLAIACGTEHPDPVTSTNATAVAHPAAPAQSAPSRTVDTAIITRAHSAAAQPGDTIFVELNAMEPSTQIGTIRMQPGAAHGAPTERPVSVKYPDGRVRTVANVAALRNDFEDAAQARAGEKVCAVKGN